MRMTNKKRKEISGRKSERYAKIGLENEELVAVFLRNAKDSEGRPFFEKVVHHDQLSRADLRGKDITVYRKVNGIVYQRSFGVTISIRRFHKTQNVHKNTPVFCTPVGFNQQNLLAKVLDLFN